MSHSHKATQPSDKSSQSPQNSQLASRPFSEAKAPARSQLAGNPVASRPFAAPAPDLQAKEETQQSTGFDLTQVNLFAGGNTPPPSQPGDSGLSHSESSIVNRTMDEGGLDEERPEERIHRKSEGDGAADGSGDEDETLPIQTKLTIGAAGDRYEQEADRMAAQVVSMPEPVLQRQNDAEDDSLVPEIQAKGRAGDASADFEQRLGLTKGSGAPMAEDVRSFMEPRFGADFSQVRVHTGSEAVQLNKAVGAQAFAHGNDVYFNAGKYSPDSTLGKELLAHELTHVLQQTGHVQATSKKSSIEDYEANSVSITSDVQGMIRRGEAGVHHGIETEATGSKQGISDPTAVEEMYAGNWMRDFSQVNVPIVFSALEQIPSRVDAPAGDTIGAEGAEDISVGLIRALAMLEFGPEITNRLITAENIGVYAPEQHIDNPIGTDAAAHLVRDSATANLRPARRTIAEEDPTERISTGHIKPENGGWHEIELDNEICQTATHDLARDQQLAGSAFPGLQAENPELYRVSDTGLANHIYNSIEWAKGQLTLSAQLGETPEGRMHMGAALHVIEDYFAHSNFIEVALNSQIDRALQSPTQEDKSALPLTFVRAVASEDGIGATHVDTLYEEEVADAEGNMRQAVTTGTFGGLDTQVSIAHSILPKLPQLGKAVDEKIDQALALIEEGEAGWKQIEEKLKEDQSGLAVLELVNAFDKHVQAPVYTGVALTYGEFNIPFTDRALPYPNGVEPVKEYKGVKSAYNSYASFYESVHAQIERIQEFRNTLVWPLTNLFTPITNVIQQLKVLLRNARNELRQRIKGQINQLMFSLIEQITGMDIPEEKKRSIGDAVHWAHHSVEDMEHQTSLESRLTNGEAQKSNTTEKKRIFGIYSNGQPIQALPPSHSEISKDHPPHEMMQNHANRWQYKQQTIRPGWTVQFPVLVEEHEHETSEGSLFFELHRQLALEADRHIIVQMNQTWNKEQAQPASEPGRLGTTNTNQPTDSLLTNARKFQAAEAERASQARRAFATGHESDIEGLSNTLALVDLFITHPDDSTWWHSILNEYVQAHEEEVIAHIQIRNKTHSKRSH